VSLLRRVLRTLVKTTGGQVLIVVVVAYLIFQAWSVVQAGPKIDNRIPQLVDQRGRVNVRVELNFRPERFHILTLQDYGRVTGTDGNTVEVRGITLDGVRDLARKYWVRRIEPLPEGQ
jgi:hypothetical protein